MVLALRGRARALKSILRRMRLKYLKKQLKHFFSPRSKLTPFYGKIVRYTVYQIEKVVKATRQLLSAIREPLYLIHCPLESALANRERPRGRKRSIIGTINIVKNVFARGEKRGEKG